MKLTFKEIVNRETYVEEVWENAYFRINKSKNGDISITNFSASDNIFIESAMVFTLDKKEVGLNEALEALEEGKEIESVVSGYKFKKDKNDYIAYNNIELECSSFYEDEPSFSIEEAKSKWYIND